MISIVIPVYNEESSLEGNIKRLVEYVQELELDYEIIFSDDGSTDDSLSIIRELSKQNSNVGFVYVNKNKGRGHALKKARSLIKGDKIIFLDADIPLTIDLIIIKNLIETLDKYGVVIGSRFLEESKIKRKGHRAFFSKVYRSLVKVFFPNLGVKDTDVGVKAFNKKVFFSVNEQVKSNRWSWDLEFLLEAHKQGFSIKEVPISWREKGGSSLNVFSASLEQFTSLFLFKFRYS